MTTAETRRRLSGSPRGGFTLIEAALSVILVAVMLVAALTTAGSAAASRQNMARQQMGQALARQLMAEILQIRYEQPNGTSVFGLESGEAGATRAAYDDVDDYNNYTETSATDQTGSPVPEASGWARNVQVCYADPAAPGGSPAASDTGLKRITVTVTAPGGAQTVLVALRGRFIEPQLTVQTPYVTMANVHLQVGAYGGPTACESVRILNPVTP
jgi:type II secretory pathway pseudopilin PulG